MHRIKVKENLHGEPEGPSEFGRWPPLVGSGTPSVYARVKVDVDFLLKGWGRDAAKDWDPQALFDAEQSSWRPPGLALACLMPLSEQYQK